MNTTERELLERCKPWLSGTGNEIAALIKDVEAYLAKPAQEPSCNPHPNAPHGFSRNASHSANRYVCECEGWSEKENIQQEPMSGALIVHKGCKTTWADGVIEIKPVDAAITQHKKAEAALLSDELRLFENTCMSEKDTLRRTRIFLNTIAK